MPLKIRHGTKQGKLGRGHTGRKTEQEKNIKEEGQEREKEREERLLERGARSAACCQVPRFPSPLYKRIPAGLNWGGGGSKEAKGPFTEKALRFPLHLRPSHPHLHLMAAA